MNGMQMLMKQIGINPDDIEKTIKGLGEAAKKVLDDQKLMDAKLDSLKQGHDIIMSRLDRIMVMIDPSAVPQDLTIYNGGKDGNGNTFHG